MKAAVCRLVAATRNSLRGLRQTYRDETAFRWEIWLTAIFLPLAFLPSLSDIERLLMIFSLSFVLAAELLNTAIEATVDLLSPRPHPLAKKAKDAASAAVFVALAAAAAVWLAVLLF